jgi:HEAT repeat protein
MRKWCLLLILLGCAAIAIATATFARKEPPREPAYNGQPLSYWVPRCVSTTTEQNEAARDAVRHIGTNALPSLIEWLRYNPEPPAWRTKLVTALPWLPQRIQRLIRVRTDVPSQFLWISAPYAFRALGTNAAAAIPELTALALNTHKPERARRAVEALESIGMTNALPALVSVANHRPSCFVQYEAVLAINHLTPKNGSANEVIGPAMLRALLTDNLDPQETAGQYAAGAAAQWLEKTRYRPAVSVPALAACLGGTNADWELRYKALVALGGYGRDAAQALPAITNALSDPSPMVSEHAQRVIQWIVGEVLAQPPPQ